MAYRGLLVVPCTDKKAFRAESPIMCVVSAAAWLRGPAGKPPPTVRQAEASPQPFVRPRVSPIWWSPRPWLQQTAS